MAHDVLFDIPDRELGRSPVEFKVKKDGENLGTLKVSQGGVKWFVPAGKTPKYEFNWTELLAMFKSAK